MNGEEGSMDGMTKKEKLSAIERSLDGLIDDVSDELGLFPFAPPAPGIADGELLRPGMLTDGTYPAECVAVDADDPRILWVKIDTGWTTVPIPAVAVARIVAQLGLSRSGGQPLEIQGYGVARWPTGGTCR